MNRTLHCLITSILFIGFLQAQPFNELGIPTIKNYSPKEYKGQPPVFGIAQDTSGFTYFTGTGIIEYDGEIWKKVSPFGADTWSLILGNDKRIYVGVTDDFGYLQPNSLGQQEFKSLLPLLPESQRNFGQLRQAIALKDAIYFASRTTGDLIHYNYLEDKVSVWKKKGKISIIGIANDELFLFIEGIGLCKLVDNRIIPLADESKFNGSPLISVLPTSNQELLVFTKDKGIFLFKDNQIVPFKTEADELLTTRVYFAKLLPDGTILVSIIGHGIITLDKTGKWLQHITKEKGLTNDIVLSAHIDSSSDVWLGTYNGLSKVSLLSSSSKFITDENKTPLTINDIIRFKEKIYAASSTSNGFLFLDKKGAVFRELKNELNDQAFGFKKFRNTLYGTGVEGVFKIKGINATSIYKRSNSKLSTFTAHQSQLDSNRIFLGLADGVISIYKNKNNWSFEKRCKEIPNNIDVRNILEYPEGRLWLGTQNQGLWMLEYKNNDFYIQNLAKGKYFEKGVGGMNLGYTYVYLIGKEITFTGAGGIYTFDESTNELIVDSRFPLPIPKKDIHAVLLAEDNEGKVYAHFTSFDKSVLLGVYEKKNDYLYSFKTDNLQKIPEEEILNVTKLYPEPNGILWIADNNGLIRLNTKKKVTTSSIPTKIRQVHLNSDSLIFAGHGNPSKPILLFSQNNINFQYLAPTINITGINQYQTKLEGFDPQWSEWTSKTDKAYTNLPENTYTFKVKGKTPTGQDCPMATYTFEVLPPWWRTWWAYLSYIFLGGLSLFLFSQWRNRQLLERSKKLELIIQERTVEIEQLFQEAQAARAAAEEANEAKSTFLSTVSHELRTPLTSVIGFAKIIKKRLEERIFPFVQTDEKKTQRAIKQVSQNLDVVVSEGERLTTLINGVLDLAKIEAGRLDWNMGIIQLAPVIRQSVAATSALFEQKSLPLHLEIAENLPSITGDKDRLIQVIINLISNAVKFTDEGSVLIKASQQADTLIVKVKDSGIGISKADLPKVFEKFKQVGDTLTDKPKGTGLGLPICKEIIEYHQGEIWAESEIGQGSSFLFSIPINVKGK